MLPDKTEKVWLFIDVLYRHMGCGPYHAHILVDIHYTPLKTKHTTTTCTAVAKNSIGLNDLKKKEYNCVEHAHSSQGETEPRFDLTTLEL